MLSGSEPTEAVIQRCRAGASRTVGSARALGHPHGVTTCLATDPQDLTDAAGREYDVYLLPRRGEPLVQKVAGTFPELVAKKCVRGAKPQPYRALHDAFYTHPLLLSHLAAFRLGRPAMMLLTLCRTVWK